MMKKTPEALGSYVICSMEKPKEKITKSGIVVVSQNGQHTTNEGSRVDDNALFRIVSVGPTVEAKVKVGDLVLPNPWTAQCFEYNYETYVAIPASELKALINE